MERTPNSPTTFDPVSGCLYAVTGRRATPTVQRSYCGSGEAEEDGATVGMGTGASTWRTGRSPAARARTTA